MGHKVLLILIDGLRPDALFKCDHPFLREFITQSCTYTLQGRSVFPSVTLPCHMSIFHSVTPERHGVTDNIYTRPVHRLDSLFDVLARQGRRCQFYYTWPQLRDLCAPDSLERSYMCSSESCGSQADSEMCRITKQALEQEKPDFLFYYTVHTDLMGHDHGWMSPTYLEAVDLASRNVETLVKALPEDYSLVITADHGGHDRTHGLTIPEDMTIPIAFYGPQWARGCRLDTVSLLQLAPTIAAMMDIAPSRLWDGTAVPFTVLSPQ